MKATVIWVSSMEIKTEGINATCLTTGHYHLSSVILFSTTTQINKSSEILEMHCQTWSPLK